MPLPLLTHFPLSLSVPVFLPLLRGIILVFVTLINRSSRPNNLSFYCVVTEMGRDRKRVRWSETVTVCCLSLISFSLSLSIHSAASADYFSTTILLTFYNGIASKYIDFRLRNYMFHN